jgi:hypothetical protein
MALAFEGIQIGVEPPIISAIDPVRSRRKLTDRRLRGALFVHPVHPSLLMEGGPTRRRRRSHPPGGAVNLETADALTQAADDFDEIAEDLERGAIEIRHPELMPQNDG